MNKRNLTAILIETRSIQEYIFLSNKLRENVGASHIVKKIYEDELGEALDLNEWKEKPDTIKFENDPNVLMEIGYIGGGNALLLFKNRKDAISFIREFTKQLLMRYPGLKASFGIVDNFNLSEFENSMVKLHENLIQNKNRFFPNATLAKYGFIADCPRTNESAEAFRDQDGKIVSSTLKVKLNASEDALNDLTMMLKDVLQEKYAITNDIEKFGQKIEDINYIAIVHIDGNKIGERLRNCDTLIKLRKLSISVEKVIQSSFKETLQEVVNKINNGIISPKNGFNLRIENNKIIIPLRPIILSGDDITVICEGRLGFWLAETFTKRIIERQLFDEKNLDACCSVVIVKTKYPFYKAYRMVKYLMNKIKEVSRKNNDSSYIDFFISQGGWTGEVIKENHYQVLAGNLHMGPYLLRTKDGNVINHVNNLKEIIEGLKRLPNNKILELRDVLYKDVRHSNMFLEELKARGHHLPTIEDSNRIWIDIGNKLTTPYYDAIELKNFYPDGLS